MGTISLSYSDTDGPHIFSLDGESTSIGRSPGQDIVLADPSVSRHHAVILREGDTCTVVDQNSTFGTFVNAVRVERAVLKAGDVLQMGSVRGRELRLQIQKGNQTLTGLLQSPVTELLSSLSELQPSAREMEKLNWLLRAARQLNEGGAIEDILSAFLHLTLQLTGLERGYVFLLDQGEMRLAQGLRSDGAILEEDSTVSRRAIQRALESDSQFLISDTSADDHASGWSSVLAHSIRSICCIPLRKRVSPKEPNQLLGVLYLDSHIERRNLNKIDHQLLDTIAAEAAALLHNALLAEAEYKARKAHEELTVAAKIHSGLMSMTLPSLPYAEIHAKSVPCLAIGGDFYDAVALDDCVCAVVADVSGKGVSAAIVAATLQGIIHSQFLTGRSLPEIAALVNHFLCTRNVGKYATMLLLKLFPDGKLEYMNCGHIPPLAIHGPTMRKLEGGDLVVGLIADASYSSAHCVLQAGQRVLVVTDGITEAEDPAGNQFGGSEFDLVTQYDTLDKILDRVAHFQAPGLAQDDCTLLEIRYLGAD